MLIIILLLIFSISINTLLGPKRNTTPFTNLVSKDHIKNNIPFINDIEYKILDENDVNYEAIKLNARKLYPPLQLSIRKQYAALLMIDYDFKITYEVLEDLTGLDKDTLSMIRHILTKYRNYNNWLLSSSAEIKIEKVIFFSSSFRGEPEPIFLPPTDLGISIADKFKDYILCFIDHIKSSISIATSRIQCSLLSNNYSMRSETLEKIISTFRILDLDWKHCQVDSSNFFNAKQVMNLFKPIKKCLDIDHDFQSGNNQASYQIYYNSLTSKQQDYIRDNLDFMKIQEKDKLLNRPSVTYSLITVEDVKEILNLQ